MLFAFLTILLFTYEVDSSWSSYINATVSFYTKIPGAKDTICNETINNEHWSLDKIFTVPQQLLLDSVNSLDVKPGDCWCGVFNDSSLNDQVPNNFRLLYVIVTNITNLSDRWLMTGRLGIYSECQILLPTLPRNTLVKDQSCKQFECHYPSTLELPFQTQAGGPTYCGGGKYPLVPTVASNSSCTWVRIDMPCGDLPSSPVVPVDAPQNPSPNSETGIVVGVCVGGLVLIGIIVIYVVYQKRVKYSYTALD